jgi:hypothetical protein
MSTPQRTHARTVLAVGRATADVLRVEAKKVAMFEHDLFEDFLDFSPEAQHGLALRYRDVFDLIDAVGWDPDKTDPTAETFEVPLTDDLINLLGLRHHDLAMSTVDRLDGVGETIDPTSSPRSRSTASPSERLTASSAPTRRPSARPESPHDSGSLRAARDSSWRSGSSRFRRVLWRPTSSNAREGRAPQGHTRPREAS